MAVALILSGGTGTRMGFDDFPKQYIEVAGKTILGYALGGFADAKAVDDVVVVASTEWHEDIAAQAAQVGLAHVPRFAEPGTTRQGSVLNGLRVAAEQPPADDIVIVHDAARPNLTGVMIDGYIADLAEYDGLMPVLPMKDTVYLSDDGSSVTELLDRDRLFAGQAPEVFRFSRYLAVNEAVSTAEIEITRGSSEIAFRHGMSIKMVEGSERNYKITTREDLKRFCEETGADYGACIVAVGKSQ